MGELVATGVQSIKRVEFTSCAAPVSDSDGALVEEHAVVVDLQGDADVLTSDLSDAAAPSTLLSPRVNVAA